MIHPGLKAVALAGAVVGQAGGAPASEPARLVPRSLLFGNPVKTSPSISPEGGRLAYLAPDAKGVVQVWVEPLDGGFAPVATTETRSVVLFRWAGDGDHVLYEQDGNGDENFHVYSVDLRTGLTRDLTPFRGARAQSLLVSFAHPSEVLVGLNLRKRGVFDVYRIDLETGALRLEVENPGDVLSWTTDGEFVVRAATAFDPVSGATLVRVRDTREAPWRELLRMPFEDNTTFGQVNGGSVLAGFRPDGRALYVVSALRSEMLQMEEVDARTGATLAVLARDPKSDVAEDPVDLGPAWAVLRDPGSGRLLAVGFEEDQLRWTPLDPAGAELAKLEARLGGAVAVTSQSKDGNRWVVARIVGDGPASFYLVDRAQGGVPRLLFEDRPELGQHRLATTSFLRYPARDGLEVPAYLSLPPGSTGKNLPLVVYPHGGPWARDRDGFDPVVQLLATRGYAVLRPQYRGSTGFGKRHLNAGNGQFGLAMEDDILDGARWAVRQGIADPKRLGILGASGGGYATLRAITVEPDMFRCAVDIVGPSELKLLFSTMPAGWNAVKTRWVRRIGDVEHDEALNRALSPLYHVDRIRTPLLIGQGANDPRVAIAHADRIVKVMRDRGLTVDYVVYPDEGHDFTRAENNLDFFGRVEQFLATHLGGSAEPWAKVEGASAEVR